MSASLRQAMKKTYIVGIDLGTSNTVVAYTAPGKQQVELFEICLLYTSRCV